MRSTRSSRQQQQQHNHNVRAIGDGTTAIAAFGDALNKPDFSDVTFKVSFSASSDSTTATPTTTASTSSPTNNTKSIASSSGKNYPTNKNNKKQQHQDSSTTTASATSAVAATTTTTIYAHRAILAARSPVFRQMFFGGFPEATQKEVSVVDEFKPEHFMTVLEWAYTGRAEMSAKDVLGVLRCANFYGFDDLVAESRDLAQSFIDEENVLHLLEHASQLGETTLVFQCLNFIKCHAHSVLTSPVWLGVSPECVERVLQLPAIDCEEALLFEQALAWLETNTTLRADLVEETEKKRKEEKQIISNMLAAGNNNNASKAEKSSKKKKNSKKKDQDNDPTDPSNEQKNKKNHQQGENDDHHSSKSSSSSSSSSSPASSDNDDNSNDDDDNEDDQDDADQDLDADERDRRAAAKALLAAAHDAPYQSSPLVRRFFKHLRLSHLSVGHLLDRVRPLLAAHPSVRPDYVSALEFLVDPGRLAEVSQVPRAPTVLATVQVDVPSEFLRGWRLVASIPQTSPATASTFGFNQAQVLAAAFFSAVPQHASYVCVGEMVVGRDDVISIIAVGTVRIVRPIINSRSPVVAEEGDICWHASTNSFGFTPKQQSSASSSSPSNSMMISGGNNNNNMNNNNSSVMSGMPGRSFAAPAPSRANQSAGVRFIVSSSSGTVNNNNSNNPVIATTTTITDEAQLQQLQQGVRHGRRFIYYK